MKTLGNHVTRDYGIALYCQRNPFDMFRIDENYSHQLSVCLYIVFPMPLP